MKKLKQVLWATSIFLLLWAICSSIRTWKEYNEEYLPKYLTTISVLVDTARNSGSGTIINYGEYSYVLTAEHVIDQIIELNEKDKIFHPVDVIHIYNEYGTEVSQTKYLSEVVAYSKEKDIAILKLSKRRAFSSSAKPYMKPELKPIGTKIYHMGCYYGRDGYNSFGEGVITYNGRASVGQRLVQTNSVVFPGSSGGGIFLQSTGEYIGMVLSMRDPSIGFYKPVQDIRKWAKTVGYGHLFGDNNEMEQTARMATF